MNESESIRDAVRHVIRTVNTPWKPSLHETVIGARITDNTASISTEIVKVTETVREWKVTHKGVRMVCWTYADGFWTYAGTFTAWDDEFVPTVTIKVGRIVTPHEALMQRRWERDCYRPGTDTQPLDNYDRVLKGSTTKSMERHW